MEILAYILTAIGVTMFVYVCFMFYRDVVSPEIGIRYLVTYELQGDNLALAFPKPGLTPLNYKDLLILQDYVEGIYGKAVPLAVCKLGYCFTNISHNDISRALYYGRKEVKRMQKENKKKKNIEKQVEPIKQKGPTLYKI